MTSLYNSIYQIMMKNNDITNADLILLFPNDNVKTIKNHASVIRKVLRTPELMIPDTKKGIQDISITALEPLIIKLLNKAPTQQNLKLALDLLKVKESNKGMTDKLDINKYILKGKSCQEDVDKKIDINEKELNIPNGCISRGKLIFDTLTHKELVKELKDNDEP